MAATVSENSRKQIEENELSGFSSMSSGLELLSIKIGGNYDKNNSNR